MIPFAASGRFGRGSMLARAEAAVSGLATDASRRVSGFAVAVLCLLLISRLSYVLSFGQLGQLPFTAELARRYPVARQRRARVGTAHAAW
jgi:hypothetical protein